MSFFPSNLFYYYTRARNTIHFVIPWTSLHRGFLMLWRADKERQSIPLGH